MSKKTTLTIKGTAITLNFGVNYFYEYYKEDSGHDLVKDPQFDVDSLKSVDLFKMIQSLIWAGYQSECSVREVHAEVTREAVKHFVMSKTDTEAVEVFYQLLSCLSGMSVEEIKNAEAQAEKQ